MKKNILIFNLILCLCFGTFASEIDLSHSTEPSVDYFKFNDADRTIGGTFFAKDFYIGDVKAPITIVEYYSFSCFHCVDFILNTLPILKKDYIDTGKVLLILRDFPLDRASLNASMLSKCYATGKHCKDAKTCVGREPLKIINAILASRQNWDNNNFTLLMNAEALQLGMQTDEINACLSDEELQSQIIQSKVIGIKHLNITGVPSLFVNGELYRGQHDKFIEFIGRPNPIQ